VGRFSVDLGRLMENAVFLHLLRLSNRRPLMEVFYWRDLAGYEVDFMVREGVETTELIQVTYAAGFDEIDRREIRGLLKAAEATGCRNLRVVTWDYEDERVQTATQYTSHHSGKPCSARAWLSFFSAPEAPADPHAFAAKCL
jgi:predicted AAA+ superfamily ATPase